MESERTTKAIKTIAVIAFIIGIWAFIVAWLYSDFRTGIATSLLVFGCVFVILVFLFFKRMRHEDRIKKCTTQTQRKTTQ